MRKNPEEKFIVFDKVDDVQTVSKILLSFPCKIGQRFEDYVCHSTRAYKVMNNVYRATEVTFRRTEVVQPSYVLTPRMKRALSLSNIEGFGTGPMLATDVPHVKYVVLEAGQLFSGPEYWKKINELTGDSLFVIAGEFFRFKELEFPMTRALYGISQDILNVSGLPEDCSDMVSLKVKVYRTHQYWQGELGRIFVPKMSISALLRLHLVLSPPGGDSLEFPSLEIHHVKVELQELLWCLKDEEAAESVYQFEWYMREQLLLDSECSMVIDSLAWSDQSEISLPISLFDCKIPEVGPTFFSNHLLRCYALKITFDVNWKEKHCPFTLSTFLEINVATKDYISSKRNLVRPPSELANFRSYTRIDRLPKKSLSPNVTLSHDLLDIICEQLLIYQSHQTDTFIIDDDVFAVSNIDLLEAYQNPTLSDISELLQEYRLTYLGCHPILKEGEAFLECEIVNSQRILSDPGPERLVGGLFIEPNRYTTKYTNFINTAAYELPDLMTNRTDTMIFCVQLHNISMHLVTYPLNSNEYPFDCFKGEVIALPGMNISQFLNIRLDITKSPNKVIEEHNFKLVVSRIRLLLKEIIRGNNCHHQDASIRTLVLLDKNLNENLTRNSFAHSNNFCWGSLVIPEHWYNCQLPDVSSTVISNKLRRGYEICVDIDVFQHRYHKRLSINQEVLIASLHRYQVRPDSLPPPYQPFDPFPPEFRSGA